MDSHLNEQEWHNDDNWSLFYFSKKDSRWIVPKRNRLGWTFNLGSKKGGIVFIIALTVPLLLTIAAILIVGACQFLLLR